MFSVNNTIDKSCNPVFYTRYVDDVFCVFRKGVNHETFMSKLNSLHANISFTVELGGTELPFLDTRIQLVGNGFTSTVFRKDTNTDMILNYSSVAPMKWKTGLVKCLVHRAHKGCSNKILLRKEIDHLRQMFFKNGYPKRLFNDIVDEFRTQQDAQNEVNDQTLSEDNTTKIILKIPFVGSKSVMFAKKIKKLVKMEMDIDIQIIYETVRIKDFFKLKDGVTKEILSKVVYKFCCSSDSKIQYIGHTNRTLRERVSEHLKGKTAVSDHIAVCKNCSDNGVSIDNFEVIKRCRNWGDTPVYEAMFIQRQNPILNRQLTNVTQYHTFTLRVFD